MWSYELKLSWAKSLVCHFLTNDALSDLAQLNHGTLRYVKVRYVTVRYGKVRYGTVRFGTVW